MDLAQDQVKKGHDFMEKVQEAFKEYVKFTPTTSVHKTTKDTIASCLLGIYGEWMEFLSTANLKLDDESRQIKDEASYKELGDIFYYIGLLVYTLEIEDEINFNYWEDMMADKVESHSLFVLIGSLQEHYKKIIRDCDWDLEVYVKREEVITNINDILWQLNTLIMSTMDVDTITIMDMNMEKLQSRKERGVIGGNGDER